MADHVNHSLISNVVGHIMADHTLESTVRKLSVPDTDGAESCPLKQHSSGEISDGCSYVEAPETTAPIQNVKIIRLLRAL